MIILDEPYVSDHLISWVEQSGHPVLNNPMAQTIAQNHTLNLVSEEEAKKRLNEGERIYTNSENALTWITENVSNPALCEGINIFKDKALTRTILQSLDKDLFFKTCTSEELESLDFTELEDHLPFILKPSVGFCSMGVYPIYHKSDWDHALARIKSDTASWNELYPNSVIDTNTFLIEGFISGTEYALDAFFDEAGDAHILTVLRHDFASETDTSDRMYLTSVEIYDEVHDIFLDWLNQVNKLVKVSNFPVHVEVRLEKDADQARVHVIEFNPLRFAGLGGTDISLHAFDFYSYGAFLENKLPSREQMVEKSKGHTFCMSLLNPPSDLEEHATFDYQAFCERFGKVVDLVPFDPAQTGMFGFAFLEVLPGHEEEIEYLKTTDLSEFISVDPA